MDADQSNDVKAAGHAMSDELVVPLYEEQANVAKRRVVTGRLQVSAVTHENEQLVDELLKVERVEVERIPVGKPIDTVPPVREDGDTIIVPVVEEVLVLERRLLLKEEVHIRRVRGTERYLERVRLRKQEAVITRIPADDSTAGATPAADARMQTKKEN